MQDACASRIENGTSESFCTVRTSNSRSVKDGASRLFAIYPKPQSLTLFDRRCRANTTSPQPASTAGRSPCVRMRGPPVRRGTLHRSLRHRRRRRPRTNSRTSCYCSKTTNLSSMNLRSCSNCSMNLSCCLYWILHAHQRRYRRHCRSAGRHRRCLWRCLQ